MKPADEPAVRSLQSLLTYADPQLLDAALDGPFVGRVAVDEGRVVSYAIALPGGETTLSELVVDPEHRRLGYGRRLLEAMVEASGADRTVVTTPTENEAAERFYRAMGFEPRERIPGFYADGAAALRLVRGE